MTRSRLAATALLLTLAALPARADDDAETRFHRAYEQEVVDGKVADAARTYLALMNDETAPERIRLEARFRFAVTTVILGRADEGRAQLAELARDPKASESLRARTAEYLEATRTIGVGSELDRKLQSLVFDLAKAPAGVGADHPQGSPYREFEVIGERAVPFLKQLAQHQDLALRAHALRILARMKEPGLAELWTPEASAANPALQWDLFRYVRAVPGEPAAFERKILALPDEDVRALLQNQTQFRAPLSADALRALVERGIAPGLVLSVWFPWEDEAADRLRAEWIRTGTPELSAKATESYLQYVVATEQAKAPDASLFAPVLARLETLPLGWQPTRWIEANVGGDDRAKAARGFVRLAGAVELDAVVAAAADLVDRAAAAPDGASNPLQSGLVEALLLAVERRADDDELPVRHAATLRRAAEASAARKLGLWNWFAPRFAGAIARLPRDAAIELAQWVATAPLQGVNQETRARAIPVGRPIDVPVAMAAARVADADTRRAIYSGMGLPNQSVNFDTQPEFARELAPFLGEVAASGEDGMRTVGFPLQDLVWYLQTLPLGEARERLLEVGRAVAAYRDPGQRRQALRAMAEGGAVQFLPPRWTEIALPALESLWPSIAPADRDEILRLAGTWLGRTAKDSAARTAIGSFLRSHAAELPPQTVMALSQSPDAVAIEDWLPHVPVGSFASSMKWIDSDQADAAVRKLSADPGRTSPAVLEFARWNASPEVRKEVFDRMLREAPLDALEAVVRAATRGDVPAAIVPMSDAAIDAGLSRVLSVDSIAPGVLSRLARLSAKRQPNERTLAAARRLLESRDRDDVLAGIEVASSLGREDLLPALGGLLDSMDADLRGKAKEAIDAIVALRRLKEETRRQAEGK